MSNHTHQGKSIKYLRGIQGLKQEVPVHSRAQAGTERKAPV